MDQKITTANFTKDVLESDLPVFVDFYADWCGPCKMLEPIIGSLGAELKGQCLIGKCNIDEEMDLAQKYHIMSIPTMILFKDGEAVDTIIGAMSKSDLITRIKSKLG